MYAQSVHDLYYIGEATVGNFSQNAIERPDDNMYLRDRFDNITHQIENIEGRRRIHLLHVCLLLEPLVCVRNIQTFNKMRSNNS